MNSSSTFCPIPWVGLSVRTNGDFRICCHANTSESQGLLSDDQGVIYNAKRSNINLDEIRNSSIAKQIRVSMLNGKWHSACSRCQNDEASGLNSRRFYSNEDIRHSYSLQQALADTSHDGEIDKAAPLMDLDIRFGNKCNLKCRSCGPLDSSSWAQDTDALHLFPGTENKTATMDWYQNESFWKQLLGKTEKVKHLYIVGGEPLLISRHFDFLQKLIEQGLASEITLEYNTNLTVLPAICSQIWPHFRLVKVGVSIDGFKDINDYMRPPSKFTVIEKNLGKLKSIPKVRTWVSATISIYSILSFIDLGVWSYDNLKDVMKDPRFVFKSHALHGPLHLNLQTLPGEAKEFVESELQKQLLDLKKNPDISIDLIQHLETMTKKYIHFMNRRDLSANWQRFKEFTTHLDQKSEFSFEDLYPHLSKF